MTLAGSTGNGASATEVLGKSVTKRDYNDRPYPGVFSFMLPAPMSAAQDLPPFWTPARDWTLYSTLFRESMWQAALSIAISKVVSMGFEVDSEVPLRAKRAQNLFLNMDAGRGFVSGLSKHLQSFCLTDNGGPIEIVRASSAAGSRILGLVPLDTFRCWRTGDPAIPVIYQDLRGGWHELHDHEVILLSDMPDQSDRWYGVGHCAAERAYRTILKLESIERYIYEKVSGQRALSLFFVNGVLPGQVEQAIDSARATAQAKGVATYLGATIVPLAGDIPVKVEEVPLAELPDGFDRKEEWDIALTTYARCLGIAVQDLQPLSGQGLGTGAQSQVLDEAAKGQGLAAWRQAFEHTVNEYALDDKTTFYFKTSDIRDRERETKVSLDYATAAETWFRMGMPYAQIVNKAVDDKQMPPEYRVENDLTPGENLADDEKPAQVDPEDAASGGEVPQAQARPNATPATPPPPAGSPPGAKEWRAWTAQVAEILDALEAQKEAQAERSTDLLAQAVAELAVAVRAPVEPPVVHVAAPIVNLPAPVVNVQAPPAPAPVVNVPAPVVHVQKDAPPPSDDRPRVITVLARDADGSPRQWRDEVEA